MNTNKNNIEIEKEYPIFYRTCLYLQKTFFYKNIFADNNKIPVNYPLAEKICSDALLMRKNNWDKYTEKLNELLKLGVDFLKLQAILEKTGKYRYSSFKEVKNNTGNIEYLWGLYFSEIFWVTHHRLFNFFLKEFACKVPSKGICLDAPVGSGIFLSNFLSINKEWGGWALI